MSHTLQQFFCFYFPKFSQARNSLRVSGISLLTKARMVGSLASEYTGRFIFISITHSVPTYDLGIFVTNIRREIALSL